MDDLDHLHKACGSYLRNQEGTRRILEGLALRYVALSDVGGSYLLKAPTRAEKEFLRGLYKKDFSEAKQVTISLKKFEAAFQGTRFEGVHLPGILEAYLGKALQTRQVRDAFGEDLEKKFLEHVKHSYQEFGVGEWVVRVFSQKSSGCYKFITNLYHQDHAHLDGQIRDLVHVLQVVKASEEHLLLPVVAAFVTKDPHGLDEGTDLLKLLTYYLCEVGRISYPKSSEEKNELLYQAGILNDMGTRLLMTYGLEAYDPLGQALGWTSFYEREEPLVLSLLNLEKVKLLESVHNKAPKSVLVFENPAVFYAVIKAVPQVTALCTSGQINLCGYRVLDLLMATNFKIIYSGDFDPEGLLIADRLKSRYKNNLIFMGYEKIYYEQVFSMNTISGIRLRQLEKIQDCQLQEIAEYMKQVKVAGYQEYMIEKIVALSSDFATACF